MPRKRKGLGPRSQELIDTLAGKDTAPFVNLYPQETWHGEATISGNLYGLLALRDTIDALLKNAGQSSGVYRPLEIFASDGEGYKLYIKLMSNWNDQYPYYSNLEQGGQNG